MKVKLSLFGGVFALAGLLLGLQIVRKKSEPPDSHTPPSYESQRLTTRTRASLVSAAPGVVADDAHPATRQEPDEETSSVQRKQEASRTVERPRDEATTLEDQAGPARYGKPPTEGFSWSDVENMKPVALPAIRLADNFPLPAVAIAMESSELAPLVSSTPEIKQATESITNRFYRELAEAATAPGVTAQVETEEVSGGETVVVAQDERNTGSLRRADLLFKAIFGNAAYNHATMKSRQEIMSSSSQPAR